MLHGAARLVSIGRSDVAENDGRVIQAGGSTQAARPPVYVLLASEELALVCKHPTVYVTGVAGRSLSCWQLDSPC